MSAPAPADVLQARAWARATLWCEGEIATMPEAVDQLQEFAVASGLVEEIGQDAVQAVLADAFAAVRDDLQHDQGEDMDEVPACNTCGGAPCVNPPFCRLCRRADAQQMRLPKAEKQSPPTPQVVVEALLYCVRERGPEALNEPANIERLGRCDDAALAEIDRRISKIGGARAS